jgi:predicted metal-dependent hydrolase
MPIRLSPIRLFERARPDPDRITVEHAGDAFPVRITRHARARRYSLRVASRTAEIILTLPARGSLKAAIAFAESQGGWIAARIQRAPERTPFAAGAHIPLRGVTHRILHRQGPRGVATAAIAPDGEPILAVHGDAAHLPRRVRDFLIREARRDLDAAVQRHAAALGLSPRKITVKDTVSRWGSCSSAGRLSFSWRLIFAPPFVLDYLAAHEVAHLREMNHSTRFWRIVAGLDPRWREAERWLSRQGGELHRYG